MIVYLKLYNCEQINNNYYIEIISSKRVIISIR